jgi:hypothetical protein
MLAARSRRVLWVAENMRRLVSCATALVVLTAASDAWCYRPFDGTDADVADFGEFELELGPAQYFVSGGSHYAITPATVLNLGFAPRWELVCDFKSFVALQPVPNEARWRLLDTDVFLKTILRKGSLQEAEGPSLATEFGPLVPNVAGEKGFGASINLIASQRWTALTLHLNEQAELTRGNLHFDWFTSLIVEGAYDKPVRPVAEVSYEREFVLGVDSVSLLVGAIWRAREDLNFDVGLREARLDDRPATEVRIGLTWGLGVWGAPEPKTTARTPIRPAFR